MKHLISANDLTYDCIWSIINDTLSLKKTFAHQTVKKIPSLRGKTILTVFYENSTRTRVSFETAGKWLSADVVNMSIATSSVGKGESLLDTFLTLEAMDVDAIILRHPLSGAPFQVLRWLENNAREKGKDPLSLPTIINAGDGTREHPTQALLDAVTLAEVWQKENSNIDNCFHNKHIVIVGDILHSRVARSNIALLHTLGARITCVAPPTLVPKGLETWGNVTVHDDLDRVLPTADAVMMLRIQQERMQTGFFPTIKEYSLRYSLHDHRRRLMAPNTLILHPGPVNRGVEISAQTIAAPSSRVTDQVHFGVLSRMILLLHALSPEHSKN